jgi:ABC-type glycerol-3-phosphate transport system substrate-binding protein
MKIKRALSVAMALVIATLAIVLVLTNRSSNEDTPPPEHIHVPEYTPSPAPPDSIDSPDFIELTLATLSPLSLELRNAIMSYNFGSTTHRIFVRDYAHYITEERGIFEGIDKLASDIAAGNVPDIINISRVPFIQWAASGMFVDLYPFIDADPELNRSDLLENVLRTAEVNGSLYQVFSAFGVNTIAGNPAVLGAEPGWTWDEFMAVVDANPQSPWPLGGQSLLNWMQLDRWLHFNAQNYIDWTMGTAHFDRGDFAELLEFFNRWPKGIDDINQDTLNDRGIMLHADIYSFQDIRFYRGLYEGELILKGSPTETRAGNNISIGQGLAITTQCVDRQAAWELVRLLLTEDFQRNRQNAFVHFFPVNKTVFYEELDWAFLELNNDFPIYLGDELFAHVTPFSQRDADIIIALMDSLTLNDAILAGPLYDIIIESVMEYFNGLITAQEAAGIIQNRALILMAEQSR